MDLKPSFWHPAHRQEESDIDLVEPATDTPAKPDPKMSSRASVRRTEHEDLEYLMERLQTIGLSVGKR